MEKRGSLTLLRSKQNKVWKNKSYFNKFRTSSVFMLNYLTRFKRQAIHSDDTMLCCLNLYAQHEQLTFWRCPSAECVRQRGSIACRLHHHDTTSYSAVEPLSLGERGPGWGRPTVSPHSTGKSLHSRTLTRIHTHTHRCKIDILLFFKEKNIEKYN